MNLMIILNLIKDFDNIYIAYGIHPDKVIENTYLSFDDVENKIKNSKTYWNWRNWSRFLSFY